MRLYIELMSVFTNWLHSKNSYKPNYMIELIEEYLGKKAKIKHLPFHKADLKAT